MIELIELSEAVSFEFAVDDRARLHAPVGLDIDAETPEEIAAVVTLLYTRLGECDLPDDVQPIEAALSWAGMENAKA